MRPTRSASRGFSLVELLMVIFIIAVILSLMMPAIVAGREAAHRTQCLNNLKQLALGLQNYEVSHGSLPPGSVNETGPIRSLPEGYHVGWIVQILPFLEQSYMYGALDQESSIYDPANLTVRRTRIHTLLCPNEFVASTPVTWGVSSYAACHHDVEAPIDVDNHGVMYLNSRIRFDDLIDGASNTICVGEKRVESPVTDLGWASGTRSSLRNTGSPLNAAPPARPSTGAGTIDVGPNSALHVGGFGSYHAARGANFTFGDGSARWISESIDRRILRCLGHRDDGEMLDRGEF